MTRLRRARPGGPELPAARRGGAHRRGRAAPGRGPDRRLVPGPLRDGPARARQPVDPGRPPQRRASRTSSIARIKQREPFRPFAPAVLVERAGEFFEIDQPDPFMTMAPRVRPDKVAPDPGGRPRRRHGTHPDRRSRRQPALLSSDRGVWAADRRSGSPEHQFQSPRADRGEPRRCGRLLPANRHGCARHRRFPGDRPQAMSRAGRPLRRQDADAWPIVASTTTLLRIGIARHGRRMLRPGCISARAIALGG